MNERREQFRLRPEREKVAGGRMRVQPYAPPAGRVRRPVRFVHGITGGRDWAASVFANVSSNSRSSTASMK